MLFPRKEGQKRKDRPGGSFCTQHLVMRKCFEEAQRLGLLRQVAKREAVHPRDELDEDEPTLPLQKSSDEADGPVTPARKVQRTAQGGAELVPLQISDQSRQTVVVDSSTTPARDHAAILKVRDPWFTMLLDGVKSWEIRGEPCRKDPGTTGVPHARAPSLQLSLSRAASALARSVS